MHGAHDLHRAGVEAEVGAHDRDAVVAVAGEVAKGGVDTAKEARLDEGQLDLFERAAVELLGDLDLAAALLGRGNNGVGLGEPVGDRRLQEHVQAGFYRCQAHFAVGAVSDRNDPDLGRRLAHQAVEIGVPGRLQRLAQASCRGLAAAPDGNQLDLVGQGPQDGAVQIIRPGRGADNGHAQRAFFLAHASLLDSLVIRLGPSVVLH